MLKTCKKCGKKKKSREFYGLQGECKECTKLRIQKSSRNIKRNCLICRKKFGTCISEINRGSGLVCSRKCFYIRLRQIIKRGKDSPAWHGGRTISKGYIKIQQPSNPRSDDKGYVMKHIIIMEKYLGRNLKKEEIIHHIDGNKSNNKLNNLMLLPNTGAHTAYHHSLRRKIKTKVCTKCRKIWIMRKNDKNFLRDKQCYQCRKKYEINLANPKTQEV